MLMIATFFLAEGVEPVGTPIIVPLALIFLMLFIFGWGVVQRSWQTTVYDQELAAHAEPAHPAEGEEAAALPAEAAQGPKAEGH